MLALLLLLPSAARAAGPGDPGEALSAGGPAGPAGLGEAQAAAFGGVESVYYNPAGLGLQGTTEALYARGRLPGGRALSYGAFASFARRGGWGMEALWVGRHGSASGEWLYGLAGALRGVLHPWLSLGARARVLAGDRAEGYDHHYGFDAGLQVTPGPGSRWSAGAYVQNAAGASKRGLADVLDPVLRAGASFALAPRLRVTGEASSEGELRAGTELVLGPAALRLGAAGRALTAGAGVALLDNLRADFGLLSHPVRGTAYRFSAAYRFDAGFATRAGRPSERQVGLARLEVARAQESLLARDYHEALRRLDRAVAVAPDRAGAAWARKAGRLRRLLSRPGLGAGSEAMRALKADGPAAFTAYHAVAAYLEDEDDRAVLLAHAAAGSAPEEPGYLRLLEGLALASGRSVDRDELLAPRRLAERRRARSLRAFYARRFDEAARLLREALWLDPEDASSWKRLGSAHFALGDRERAREAWVRALELDGKDARLRSFLAELGEAP